MADSSVTKQVLIERMRSSDPEVAAEAVYQLRVHKWLQDGSLRNAQLSDLNIPGVTLNIADLEGAALYNANLEGSDLNKTNLKETYLWFANLRGATLRDADLSGANLWKADLSGAYLFRADLSGSILTEVLLADVHLGEADLSGAQVTDDQLAAAAVLWGATLPAGTRYDGRFDLPGDRQIAAWQGVDLSDEETAAWWYTSNSRDVWDRFRAGNKRWEYEVLLEIDDAADLA